MNLHGENVAGILLAAGASTRMGAIKQLLPIEGGTLLGRVIGEALGSDLDKVILVLGYEANEIRKSLGNILAHPKLKVIENKRYEEGISTSIISGLSEVEKTCNHVMILLGDMPAITSALINLLLRRFLESRLPIGAISIKGERSHPVIFNRIFYPELKALRGDIGARALFAKYPYRICFVEPEQYFDDRDIDTPDDYLEFGGTLSCQTTKIDNNERK
jgi:molybdenum cofactor cytidylyltransferase